MSTRHHTSVGAASFALLLSSLLHGCSSSQQPPAIAGTGGLGLELTLAPLVSFGDIQYQITQNNAAVRSGSFSAGAMSAMASAFIAALPPGTGYALTLTATATVQSSAATTQCTGSASFGVVLGTTTVVGVLVRCPGVSSDSDSAGHPCPQLTAIRALPSEAPLGQSIALKADVTTAAGAPGSALTWTASGGQIADPHAPSTAFQCVAPGVFEIGLAASDDPKCASESASVVVMCVDPSNPAPGGSAGVPSLPPAWQASGGAGAATGSAGTASSAAHGGSSGNAGSAGATAGATGAGPWWNPLGTAVAGSIAPTSTSPGAAGTPANGTAPTTSNHDRQRGANVAGADGSNPNTDRDGSWPVAGAGDDREPNQPASSTQDAGAATGGSGEPPRDRRPRDRDGQPRGGTGASPSQSPPSTSSGSNTPPEQVAGSAAPPAEPAAGSGSQEQTEPPPTASTGSNAPTEPVAGSAAPPAEPAADSGSDQDRSLPRHSAGRGEPPRREAPESAAGRGGVDAPPPPPSAARSSALGAGVPEQTVARAAAAAPEESRGAARSDAGGALAVESRRAGVAGEPVAGQVVAPYGRQPRLGARPAPAAVSGGGIEVARESAAS